MFVDPHADGWETRYSSTGLLYQVRRPAMPWIDPEYLESVVYLYPSEAAAEDGERVGGTGFLVGIALDLPGKRKHRPRVLCVVTNKHVTDSGNYVVRINRIDGRKDIIPLDQARWYHHPDGDDLAVCPVRLSFLHQAKSIPVENFLTKEKIRLLEIGPGDDTFVIGRFMNHEGKQRNLPTVRFGNIAQMPWEPIVIDGISQESFLVEVRSISGYSGSPVFVHIPPPPSSIKNVFGSDWGKLWQEGKVKFPGVSLARAKIPIPLGPWLLGVDFCHIRAENEKVWSRFTNRPVQDDWFVKSTTGMMGVIPAWRLEEILMGPEMKPMLAEATEMAKRQRNTEEDSPVDLDVAVREQSEPPTTEDNPQHREDFTALVNAAARTKRPADET